MQNPRRVAQAWLSPGGRRTAGAVWMVAGGYPCSADLGLGFLPGACPGRRRAALVLPAIDEFQEFASLPGRRIADDRAFRQGIHGFRDPAGIFRAAPVQVVRLPHPGADLDEFFASAITAGYFSAFA